MQDAFRGISGSSIEFQGNKVRKKATPGGEHKLRLQAYNMRKLYDLLGTNALAPEKIERDGYVMPYYPGVTFDVYCSMCSQQVGFSRLKEIIATLYKKVYSTHNVDYDMASYVRYIKKRLLDYAMYKQDITILADLLTEMSDLLNGKTPFESMKGGIVHGDLTFENILVTADNFVLIDSNPPPDKIAPWTLDIGKLRQSLFSRYEITKYTGTESKMGLECTYKYLSDRFARLFPCWNEELDMQARFFEASHYIRLLDYQYVKDPKQAVLYYQKAVLIISEIVTALKLWKLR